MYSAVDNRKSCYHTDIAMKNKKSTKRKGFLLRVDPALISRVVELAVKEKRSINAQIQYMLECGLRKIN